MAGARERLEGVKVRWEVRHVSASERSRGGQAETDDFDGLGLKTISGGWFPGFGHKTGGGLGAAKVRADVTWRHREACIEAKRSREDGVSVRGSYKKLDEFTPAWAVIVNNNIVVFLSSEGDLEDKKRELGIHSIRSTSSSHPLLLLLSCSLYSLLFT